MLRGADPVAPSRTLSPKAVGASKIPTVHSGQKSTAMVISPDADPARFAPRHDLYHRSAKKYSSRRANHTAPTSRSIEWEKAGRVNRDLQRRARTLGLVESGIVKRRESREDRGPEGVLATHQIAGENAPAPARPADGCTRDLIDDIAQLAPFEDVARDVVGQQHPAPPTVAPPRPIDPP